MPQRLDETPRDLLDGRRRLAVALPQLAEDAGVGQRPLAPLGGRQRQGGLGGRLVADLFGQGKLVRRLATLPGSGGRLAVGEHAGRRLLGLPGLRTPRHRLKISGTS